MTERLHNWPVASVGDLLKRVRRPVDVRDDAMYREIGIRSHCKGIFHKQPTTGAKIGSKRVFWVEPDCLILNIVFAWEHAIALTTDREVGMIASHRFPMYTARNGKMLPEYAWRYFSSARGKYNLQIASPGGAGRNKTLGQEEFIQLRIPVPPTRYQQKAIDILATTDRAIARTDALLVANQRLKNGLAQQLLFGQRRSHSGTWRSYEFDELFDRANTDKQQIQRSEYLESGRFPIVDQGKQIIAGYSNDASKVYRNIPVIVFGDHTRELKFIDFPFVCGADGTQLLRTTTQLSIRFGYQLLKHLPLPSLGYSRHMRLLREQVFCIPENRTEQQRVVSVLAAADRVVGLLEKKLAALRDLKRGLMQRLLIMSIPVSTRTDATTMAELNGPDRHPQTDDDSETSGHGKSQ